MYFGDPHRANEPVYTLSRKTLALVVVLTLAFGAFLLASGEAQAEQKEPAAGTPQPAAAVPQSKEGTDSLAPPVPAGEVLSPVQTPAAVETALPQAPPPASMMPAAPLPDPATSATRTTTAPAEAAPPRSLVADDATTTTSPVDPSERRSITDDKGKPSMPLTGGTARMVEDTAPMPKEEEGTDLRSPVARQQAPAPAVDSKNKNSASQPASPWDFVALAQPESESAALFEGMELLEENDPLARPEDSEGKVSSSVATTSADRSVALDQGLLTTRQQRQALCATIPSVAQLVGMQRLYERLCPKPQVNTSGFTPSSSAVGSYKATPEGNLGSGIALTLRAGQEGGTPLGIDPTPKAPLLLPSSSYAPGAIGLLTSPTDARHTMLLPLGGSGKPVPQKSPTAALDQSAGLATPVALPVRASPPLADAAAPIGPPPAYYATTVSSITTPATSGSTTTTSAVELPRQSIVNAAAHLRSTAESAAASAAKAWQAFAGLISAAEEPYAASSRPAATREGMPAAPQQPSSPTPEPSDYGSFALSNGGSALSTGGSLMLGVLALGGLLLLRRDFGTYLAWCEPPRLGSALLMPLERPG